MPPPLRMKQKNGMILAACQKNFFDKLVDGGASYPQFAMVVLHLRTAHALRRRGVPPLWSASRCPRGSSRFAASDECSPSLLIGLTSRCFAHRARASCAPRHCHPYQFPLKSYGFPGAKTAMKRFLLWKMRFSDAKISPASAAQVAGDDFNARGLRFHNSAWSFRIARKLACGSPCLIGLTPRCFAHRARASCAPLALSPGVFDSMILHYGGTRNGFCRDFVRYGRRAGG